jgi:hypothetical protein
MTRGADERIRGKWRITEVEGVAPADVDLEELAHIEFLDDGIGGLSLIGIDADVDYVAKEEDHKPSAEFTWAGFLRRKDICGRGHVWTDGRNRLMGFLWIHMGERLMFRATRWGRWLYDERMKKTTP